MPDRGDSAGDPPESRTLELQAERRARPGGRARRVLYVVLECGRPLAGGARWDVTDDAEILIGRGTARALERHPDGVRRGRVLRLPDRRVSTKHARLYRAEDGQTWFEDLGSTNGSRLDGREERGPLPLPDRCMLEIGGTFLAFDAAASSSSERLLDVDWERAPRPPFGTASLIPALEAAMSDLAQLAITDVPILLLGETGTGKELVARAVHELSGRSGPFVAVNCGALAGSLLEGQLFGHVRGAFSGAERDEPGLVRASHRGTLFLDEVGELPLASQAALLRVLQEREVLPVGGTKPIPVDTRVVAATLKPIDRAAGGFRSDLYARLAGFSAKLLPLRDRREDLGLVISGILERLQLEGARDVTLTPEAARAILEHPLPYNAREIHQALSVAVTLTKGGAIDVDRLPEAFRNPPAKSGAHADAPSAEAGAAPARDLDADDLAIRDELLARLQATAGNVSEVARAMGRTRMQIHRWMKRFAIDPERYRG